jgi:hypothetical protein
MQTLEEAVASYEAAMTVEAAGYLLGRGLTEETVLTARLGVVADPIPAHERYKGWLAIPYITQGQPVRVRFRRPDWLTTEGQKYGQPSGETVLTYGVDDIHAPGDVLHVTEGEFDRLILKQCGLSAIAFPGANTFKRHHGRMLAGFNRIYVWGDPDQAGADFITTIVNRLPRSGRGVKLRGGDVTETYLEAGGSSGGGAKAIYNLIKEA